MSNTTPHPEWNSPLVEYGVGAFESMRLWQGHIPLWNYHRARLARALVAWKVDTVVLDQIESELGQWKNRDQLRLKLLLGLMPGGRVQWHWYEAQLKLTARPRRLLLLAGEACTMAYKSCNYERHFLARQLAQSHECDDALYAGEDGTLYECSGAALFALNDNAGTAVSSGILASVTRRRLLEDPTGFWTAGTLRFSNLQADTRLVIGNAVQGLVQVGEVVDAEGSIHYRAEYAPGLLVHWNGALFSLR